MRVLPLLFATAIVLFTTSAVLVTSLPTEEVINLVREARKHVPAGASAELTAQALSSVATRSQMVTTSIVGDSFKSGFAGAMDTIAEKAGRGAGKGGELMTELFPDKELRIAFKASKGPEPVAFLARLGLRSGAITEVKASTIDDLVYLYRTRLDAGLKLSDQEKLLLTDLLEMQRDGQLIAKDGKYIVKESAVKLPLKAGTFARQAQVLKISAEQLEEGALRVLNRRRSVAKSEIEFWEQKIAELKKMSSMQRGSRGDAKIAYFESQANAARAQLEKLQLPTASTSIRNEIMLVQKRPLVNPTPSPADIAAASRLLQNEIDSVTATITKRRLALQETKIANFANAEKRSVTANLELQKADLATVEKIAELEARLAELQTISGPQYALLIAAGTR